MLESLFNKATGQACKFIKKKIQHRCFLVNFEKLLRAVFSLNTSGGCFWLIWTPQIWRRVNSVKQSLWDESNSRILRSWIFLTKVTKCLYFNIYFHKNIKEPICIKQLFLTCSIGVINYFELIDENRYKNYLAIKITQLIINVILSRSIHP